jgi:hypothetical protein
MDIQDFYAFLNVSRYLKRRIWNEQAVSSKGTKISDSELDLEILSWANERVAAAGKRRRITSFHDRSIASGLFLVSADAHSISFLLGSFSPVLLQSNELGAPQMLCWCLTCQGGCLLSSVHQAAREHTMMEFRHIIMPCTVIIEIQPPPPMKMAPHSQMQPCFPKYSLRRNDHRPVNMLTHPEIHPCAQVDLLAAVEPRCIDLAMVTAGGTPRERELNAKYVISIARKLGCCIFLLWEDVVEVNSKMVLVFVASLMLHTIQRSREPSPAGSPSSA